MYGSSSRSPVDPLPEIPGFELRRRACTLPPRRTSPVSTRVSSRGNNKPPTRKNTTGWMVTLTVFLVLLAIMQGLAFWQLLLISNGKYFLFYFCPQLIFFFQKSSPSTVLARARSSQNNAFHPHFFPPRPKRLSPPYYPLKKPFDHGEDCRLVVARKKSSQSQPSLFFKFQFKFHLFLSFYIYLLQSSNFKT